MSASNGAHDAEHTPLSAVKHSQNASASAGAGAVNTLADLVSNVRRTRGEVPPPLVGFTSTVLGNHLYIWGGRLVHVRRMVADLWVLDLHTLVWEKTWPPRDGTAVNDSLQPTPRYFHSAAAWGTKVVVFGGMGQDMSVDALQNRDKPGSQSQNEVGPDPSLSVLNDILIYDTIARSWSAPETRIRDGIEAPLSRYAHLCTITNGCLVVLGGQDILNRYIEQICCLDLETMTWVHTQQWKGHVGTYRSIATSRIASVEPGGSSSGSKFGTSTTFRNKGHQSATSDANSTIAGPSIIDETMQLPFSTPPLPDEPVYTFTNYNFAEVRRELDMLSAPSSPDWACTVTSLSDSMVGNPSLPPGLRFPTASMVGHYMVLTGTLITQQVSSFAIWVLDLSKAQNSTMTEKPKRPTLKWTKIDPGHLLRSGSWNRAVTWKNNVVVLGDRDREIAVDYNRRQNNFTHIVFVDLETFGFYHPPPRILPLPIQEFGLTILNNHSLADFDIVCNDDVRLPCSRKMLEERWPWFRQNYKEHGDRLGKTYKELDYDLPGNDQETSMPTTEYFIRPHQLYLAAKSTVGQALLQYFYTLNLITPLQQSVKVLTSLLVLAQKYKIDHLRSLVTHALHIHLSNGQGSPAAIYEAATLGRAIALQTRALKMMMNHNAAAIAAKLSSTRPKKPVDIDPTRRLEPNLGIEHRQ